jgi:hypothetical protein
MKLSALALLVAAATACFAQSAAPNSGDAKSHQVMPAIGDLTSRPQSSQTGCPVVLTNASLNTKAHYMPAAGKSGSAGGNGDLSLQFRNMSGKQIQSVGIVAELNVKRSVYDLDATAIQLHLMLTGTGSLDKNSDLSRMVPLTVAAFGLGRISVEQVNYSDGTVWNAASTNNCSLEADGGLRNLVRLK